MKTLSQILIDINSYLDLTAELPTGDDLDTRINFAQQSVYEWASSYRWKQLNDTRTVFATGATISLPSNFRELISPPSESRYVTYPEVAFLEVNQESSSDRYSYVYGGPVQGSLLVVNGLPAAGATLTYQYQRYPSNMATLTDICEVPDADFVKLRTISYVLQSRLDERFPIVDAEAKRVLGNMIGRETVQRPGGYSTMRRFGLASWSLGARN